MAYFDPPPLVEKDSLPDHLKPENNLWVKMKCKVNGVAVKDIKK